MDVSVGGTSGQFADNMGGKPWQDSSVFAMNGMSLSSTLTRVTRADFCASDTDEQTSGPHATDGLTHGPRTRKIAVSPSSLSKCGVPASCRMILPFP